MIKKGHNDLKKSNIIYSPLSNKRAGWNKQAGGHFLNYEKGISHKSLQLTKQFFLKQT